MNPTSHSEKSAPAAVSTKRIFPVPPARVFAAFECADRLAQWWGPNGFTNTFDVFEFRPGGRWIFVMHAPNGASFPNESVFREIEPGAKIVIDHVVEPRFRLTITLSTHGDSQTHLSWSQEFESAEFASRMRAFVEPANEQNLDRLAAMLIQP